MTSNSSKFATQFAPYAPPPDEYQSPPQTSNSTSKFPARPWFPVHASSDSAGAGTSYQSGGIPTFGTSNSGGAGNVEAVEAQNNQWETRYGMRVDVLAAACYLLGPITAFGVLITETQNDYVRFHAYQSALLLTPLVILRIFAALIGFWSWLQTLLTLAIVCSVMYMAQQAYRDAAHNGLTRFHLPRIGQIADEWVEEE